MAADAGPRSGALALRAATAAVLLAGLLAALFLLPRGGYAVIVGAILALGAVEWGRLCRLPQTGAWAYAGGVLLAGLACAYAEPWSTTFAVAAAFWIVAVPLWLGRGVSAGQAPVLAVAGFLVLVPAGLGMLALPPVQLLLVLGGVWVADTAAYFVGRAWGRRRLAPTISPGKTWEGAIGGLAGVLAYAGVCGAVAGGLGESVRWSHLFPAAAVLAALSIYGDLFESAVKRQAGRKDSGALLPGHGGILDRIDSATAVLPVAALALPWIMGGR